MKALLAFLSLACCSASTTFNFRSDRSLDQSSYPEGTWAPIPEEGGRLHFISHAEQGLKLVQPLKVDFGGFHVVLDADIYPDDVPGNGLDWCHSQYNGRSGSVFTSLHAHVDDVIESISRVKVTDATGKVVVNDEVKIEQKMMKSPDVQVTYFTTQNDFKEMVLHLHNYGEVEYTVEEISVNTDYAVFAGEGLTLKSGEHTVITRDVSSLSFKEADVWTVTLQCSETDTSSSMSTAYGGRLNKELFPIEDWPKGEQCPYPVDGANSKNFDILQNELHLNTHFMGSRCDADSDDIFNAAAASNGTWFVLPSESYSLDEEGMIPEGAYEGVAALFVGDESDAGLEKTWDVWNRVLTAQKNTNNKYAIYDGGHSNHLNGAFSGVSDIQGMDFYVAACAPHITLWTSDMRLQGAYDYLYNTRENHKPLTTWLYSQGWCKDCWSVHEIGVGELIVQLGSVIAAGGKGMMLFQSDVSLQGTDAWVKGGSFLSSVALLAERLRVSDVEGASFSTSADRETDVIMQTLSSPDSVLLVVLNTRAGDYNDKTCALQHQHWIFEEQVVDTVTIAVPAFLMSKAKASGVTASKYFQISEVIDGVYKSELEDVNTSVGDDGVWHVEAIKLGTEETVARIFLLSVA